MHRSSSKATTTIRQHGRDLDAGASYLCDGLLLASNETEESTKHTEEGEESASKSDTRLRMSLESRDRVDTGEGNEGERLVTKELNRVLSKGRRLIKRFFLIVDGILNCSLLEGMFDLESLRSQSLSIINGVTNVNVVEKDIFRHSPKLNTNTALFNFDEHVQIRGQVLTYNLFKALYGRKIFKVIWVGDLAGGPLALVGRVVDHGGVPLALVEWICLVGAMAWEY